MVTSGENEGFAFAVGINEHFQTTDLISNDFGIKLMPGIKSGDKSE
jgi:hypothetical protein